MKALDYTIGEDKAMMTIPAVVTFCDEHRPILEFQSAMKIVGNETVSLTYVELETTYGIRLEARNMTIFSRDTNLIGITIEVIVKSTVAEETSWANLYILTFSYLRVEESTLELTTKNRGPRFDSAKMRQVNSLLFYEYEEG